MLRVKLAAKSYQFESFLLFLVDVSNTFLRDATKVLERGA
jgi:hypothetical protein